MGGLRRSPLPIDAEDHVQPRRRVSWTQDGLEISGKRILPNGSLEVSRRKNGSEGVYQCNVRQYGGTVLGHPVHLKYAYIDKQFTTHPENRTVGAGQPVTFSCSISSEPEPQVMWMKDGEALPEDHRHFTLKNNLLILDVRKEDEGIYRCIATNIHTNKPRTSHGGRLTVEEPSATQVDFSPLNLDDQILVPLNGSTVLACPVLGFPRPEIIWEWTAPNAQTGEMEYTEQVLVLKNTQVDQEGVYTCRVVGHQNLTKSFNLTVTEPVTIIQGPVTKQYPQAGTARFGCTSVGRPTPTVTWYKDGVPVALVGRAKLLRSMADNELELVISSVTSDDAGIYQCFASNGITTATAWGVLTVGDGALPPCNVTCQPISAYEVKLDWCHPDPELVVAYTVHRMREDENDTSSPGGPTGMTSENVTLDHALTPYRFQVRAYSAANENRRSVKASDLSEPIVCMGQGVPLRIRKQDGRILVSWQGFSNNTPGVVEWVLQEKTDDGHVHQKTLAHSVTNYTLEVPETGSRLIRVLGTKTKEWLNQDLSLLTWTNTSEATDDLDFGDVSIIATELELLEVAATSVAVKWRCDEAEQAPQHYSFIVCVRRKDQTNDSCQESTKMDATIEGLEADSDYEIRVQVRAAGIALGGPFSAPYQVHTQPPLSPRFRELSYKYVNSSTILVSWGGEPSNFTVQHTAQLRLPVDVWTNERVMGNSILINIDPSKETYIMVTADDTLEHSRVLNVPKAGMTEEIDIKNIKYKVIGPSIEVSWPNTPQPRFWARWTQKLSAPIDKWTLVNLTEPVLMLTDLEPDQPVYVTVTSISADRINKILTIPVVPAQSDNSKLYLGIGVACGVLFLSAVIMAVLCFWRRRKRLRSPMRSRRRSGAETSEDEGSELQTVGGRLANGGTSAGAGEPLLNGHIQIIENPTVPRTPNGKTRKNRQYEAAFDLSRHDDPNTTLETTLGSDTHPYLDTSRSPERSELLDDNMNSEVKGYPENKYLEVHKDNSKVSPTLQPNG